MTIPTIPLTQRAAVLTELGRALEIRTDFPVTQPDQLKPNECLVKLDYSGVCHSDLHIKNGDWGKNVANLPLVGGHEGVGRVVAVGPHSSVQTLKIGDRVGVKWIGNVCHHCDQCRKGHESACIVRNNFTHGFRIGGTFQEYVVSFLEYLTPVPEELDGPSTAPLLCAGLTVYKALKQANLIIGQWVAITGAGGGLGHLAIQYAVAMGFRVLAIDTGETKKQLSLKMGAERWIDFRESGDDLIKDIQAATSGGPQAAVVLADDPRPFNQAVMYLRPTGTLVAVGMPGGNAALTIPIALMISKCLNIVGSAIGNRQDAIEALTVAALGKAKCQHEVRELEDINQVFEDMAQGKISGRVVLRLNQEL